MIYICQYFNFLLLINAVIPEWEILNECFRIMICFKWIFYLYEDVSAYLEKMFYF